MPSWFSSRHPHDAASSAPPPRAPAAPSALPRDTAATTDADADAAEPSELDKYLFGDAVAMMEDPAPLGVGMPAAPHDLEMRPSILEFRSSRFSRVNPQRAQMLAAMAHAANAYAPPAVKQPPRPLSDDDGDSDDDDRHLPHHSHRATYSRHTLNKTALASSLRSTTSSTRTTEKTNADDDEEDDDDDDNQQQHERDEDEDDDDESYDAYSASDLDASADEYDLHTDNRQSRRSHRQRTGNNNHKTDDSIALMAMPEAHEVPLLEVLSDDESDDLEVDAIILGDRPPERALPRTMVVDEHGFQLSRESVLVSAARLDRSAPLKTGLLFKQGFSLLRGKGGGSGGWKVRHVVLTGTKMAFFREEHGRRRGEIDLAQCTTKSIEIMPRDSVYDGAHATVWRFAVRGRGGRRVLLAAYSEAEMKDWLRALHVALAVQNGAGWGRFTDFGVVPSGTFLADKSDGLLRSSANFR